MDKVQIKKLCFSYGDEPVLNNLNLTLGTERPVLLLGKSGIGKTTLLRLLLGFLKPDSGKISGIAPETRISVMYQEDRLFPQMTVYNNLRLIKKDLSRKRAGELLEELGLTEKVLDKLPAELSGGMRRRAALARCLIFPSQIVLMDEPFQGLDAENRENCLKAVKKYTSGRPTLIISHEASDAEALGAEIVRMEEISESSR